MKTKIWLLDLMLFFFLGVAESGAISVLSTDDSVSQDKIKAGVSDGIVETVAKHAADWIANGVDKLGNWALKTMFQIYDKYIGTFLIKIPDLAAPRTYMALASDLSRSGEADNAVNTVLNILKITSGFGLFILVVGFVIDTGQRSSGFWNRFLEGSMVISFVFAFVLIFAWPTVHSYMTNAVSDLGYYIYNQNTMKTSGVFAGLNNIDLNAPGQVLQNTQIDFRGNFISSQGIFWNLIYLFSIALVVIGFYNCYSAISAGESVKGNIRFFQAVSGIILILGVPTLVHVFIAKGADKIGTQPVIPGESLKTFSLQGLVTQNGIEYPQGQPPRGNIPSGAAPVVDGVDQSRFAKFSGGLIKCLVAVWGLVVCFTVIFAKFFQVLNIWVIFILGPVFIGCLGHPSTAPIFWGALRYFVKLLLYSVIWAITLVGLYLIPNIDWGIETIGVNSLLTALAVLAGLQMISNTQEFASLFTSFQGANLKGEGINEFARDSMKTMGTVNSARTGSFGALKGATGETGQAVASAAGATMGSIIPGVGTVGGAMAAQKLTQGINVVGQIGSFGGRDKGEGAEGSMSSMIKNFSGNIIMGGLQKDSERNSNPTPQESQKRDLIATYAKKLQSSGQKPPSKA